jgi:hypothetical protein
MRATGNRLGAHLPLVSCTTERFGKSVLGQDLHQLSCTGQLGLLHVAPNLPPPPTSEHDRGLDIKASYLRRDWEMGQLLIESDFDASGFTLHGCKATNLATRIQGWC